MHLQIARRRKDASSNSMAGPAHCGHVKGGWRTPTGAANA
eukprot:CAMPEP_0204511350 /NCGR_PEP_ID=MMETSP0661-20131031/378_1 /ASSEMBLY_ACC=CAM_ASM_000606 /TAXON_ID=109239 /ORGANISM="Alexandrium margalefi, Strain AMGDE01CS-322" /LENGTH=39 /DNA_ID= /DNA_START= /DNA_END= /DNA_ORIENTATION=